LSFLIRRFSTRFVVGTTRYPERRSEARSSESIRFSVAQLTWSASTPIRADLLFPMRSAIHCEAPMAGEFEPIWTDAPFTWCLACSVYRPSVKNIQASLAFARAPELPVNPHRYRIFGRLDIRMLSSPACPIDTSRSRCRLFAPIVIECKWEETQCKDQGNLAESWPPARQCWRPFKLKTGTTTAGF